MMRLEHLPHHIELGDKLFNWGMISRCQIIGKNAIPTIANKLSITANTIECLSKIVKFMG